MRASILSLMICFITVSAYAKYSGGTGVPDDPYQIATTEDLMLLGDSPEDYNKHFFLTADIDLDPNLPGRKVFEQAVIAPCGRWWWGFSGTPFTGVFDGNGHTISYLTIRGQAGLGLFGCLASGAEVKDLCVADVNIIGSSSCVGAIVGGNGGDYWNGYQGGVLTNCNCSGTVTGGGLWYGGVGGLAGSNKGEIADCYSTASVSGTDYVGGLVGTNGGVIRRCYSTGAVSGSDYIGGLVGSGRDLSDVTCCYSTGTVRGCNYVGGLMGEGNAAIQCYSTGAVISTGTITGVRYVGGMLGSGWATACVWDMETSGLSGNDGGVGLTTAEMMDPNMLGLNGFANDPNWVLDAGRDYPRLAWEKTPGAIIPEPIIDWMDGTGTPENPYWIETAEQLIVLGKAPMLWNEHFVLGADIDLDPNLPGRRVFGQSVIQSFTGVFDGNGHTISNLTTTGGSLFGHLEVGEVSNLGVLDVNVVGSNQVGGLVGSNGGNITNCYSTGMVRANGEWGHIGGLVGTNWGTAANCYSTCSVRGSFYSSGYSGGFVGYNDDGRVTHCYSTGAVNGRDYVGGLIGGNSGTVSASFWDIQSSGRTYSAAGTGKTKAEMQTANTFLNTGWDFVDETENGTEDIWWIDEGKDYPRLWWEPFWESSLD